MPGRVPGLPSGGGHRVRRAIDVTLAGGALIAAAPVLAVAAMGIALSSPGPILYRATRIGLDRRRDTTATPDGVAAERRQRADYYGREFTLLKLRTMHLTTAQGSPITAARDPRVFRVGAWLRATKIDELPQLINVIKGDMALVGPRPEAPEIVRSHYKRQDLETLQVLPGLTSPGSLHYYEHGEALLQTEDATQIYVDRLLPVKLAIDRAYVSRSTLGSDFRTLLKTIRIVAARALTGRLFHRKRSGL
jgi:lipopolysaccharide/colanic/teichoic acid biosynthesis glycosyltransferase